MKEDKTTSNIPTEEEVKRSDLYLELTTKLGANTRKLEELDNKSSVIKKEWSTALADAEISKKALEDMQSNFSKRWAELTDGKEQKADVSEGDCESGESAGISSAKEIITLQHKLTQALESVLDETQMSIHQDGLPEAQDDMQDAHPPAGRKTRHDVRGLWQVSSCATRF